MMTIYDELCAIGDKEYAEFQSKLTPGIDVGKFIGVRVPETRKLAKRIMKEQDVSEFMKSLPHEYYDENMIHGMFISEIKDYDETIEALEKFLPYVDNWAVCDTIRPKAFKKHKQELIQQIEVWAASSETYTCRFGMEMLMTHFLDEDFKPEYLEIPAKVRSQEYYVNMMTAWLFATALAKQWDSTIKYIEEGRLDVWTHNKTIQKARESYRITGEQKEYLKTLKR